MSSQLEEALSRTLTAAASVAPEHPPGLLQEVEAGHRKRRRRGYAAIAGVAVFAMVGGVALAFGGLPGVGRGPGVPAAQGAQRPIEEVWPEAYHALSAKLDDGRKHYPELMINDHELLVTTSASLEVADEIWIIDLDDQRARRVAFLPEPHDNQDLYASHFTVGSGHVVWWDSYTENGKPYARIWKAPLSGGEPTLVSRVSGPYGSLDDGLVVADGTVYLSHSRVGGVRQVPLSGGEATAVADTRGYHILQWPWVGKPASGPLKPADESEGGQFTTIRNVETDDVREAVEPDGVRAVACHVTYCVGVKADPESEGKRELGSFRRDGSEYRPLSARLGLEAIPVWDRFLVMHSGKGFGLYDLKTGKSGDFGIEPDGDGGMTLPRTSAPEARLMSWSIDDGKAYAILDLAAIR